MIDLSGVDLDAIANNSDMAFAIITTLGPLGVDTVWVDYEKTLSGGDSLVVSAGYYHPVTGEQLRTEWNFAVTAPPRDIICKMYDEVNNRLRQLENR